MHTLTCIIFADAASSLHIRQKRGSSKKVYSEQPGPTRTPSLALVAYEIVDIMGLNGKLGEGFVVGLFSVITHAHIFPDTSVEGRYVSFTSAESGRLNIPIEHIAHPHCTHIRNCSPNVAVLHISLPGILPGRKNLNNIFNEEIGSQAIDWAYNYIFQGRVTPRL